MSEKIAVKNRSSSRVGYKIESLRVYRSWKKTGDVLFIPKEELIELRIAVPGGLKLLEDYLLIEDETARSEVFGYELEPEYAYSEKEIEYLLYEGPDEQFLDCLDYAPYGVLEIIKQMAIKKKPNTTVKFDAINEKFKINLNTLIVNAGSDISDEETITSKRRAAPVIIPKEEKTEGKYKVVKK